MKSIDKDSLQVAVAAYLSRTGSKEFKPSAFLFDMDGVIFDSMPRHSQAWRRAFADIGIDFPLREAYMQEGKTGKATIYDIYLRLGLEPLSEEEMKAFYKRKSRYFEEFGDPIPMKNADKVLEAVKQKNYRIALVTGSGQESLLGTLNVYYPGCFDKGNVVSAADVKKGKPDPEPYLMGLERLGVNPWEAIVVENAPLGVQAGVAAGIFTIGVNTGILEDKVLSDAGADLVLPDMGALLDLVNAAF